MEMDNQDVTQAAQEVEQAIHRLAEGAPVNEQDRAGLLRNIRAIEADDAARLGKDEPGAVGSALLTLPMVTDLNILRGPPIFEFGKSIYRDAFRVIEQIAGGARG